MELLLIRHGEAAVTGGGGTASYGETAPLTDRGRQQAEFLARRLAAVRVDHLYASPLRRARETAEIVVAALGIPARTDPRFREINTGAARSSDLERVRTAARAPESGDRPIILDFADRGGESAAQFGRRASEALNDLLIGPHGATDERVALVCHGGFINAALCAIQGVPFTGELFFPVKNTSITTVRIKGQRRLILTVNDSAHLAPMESGPPGAAP